MGYWHRYKCQSSQQMHTLIEIRWLRFSLTLSRPPLPFWLFVCCFFCDVHLCANSAKFVQMHKRFLWPTKTTAGTTKKHWYGQFGDSILAECRRVYAIFLWIMLDRIFIGFYATGIHFVSKPFHSWYTVHWRKKRNQCEKVSCNAQFLVCWLKQ